MQNEDIKDKDFVNQVDNVNQSVNDNLIASKLYNNDKKDDKKK